MTEVIVSFLDGELLYGELADLNMDDPFVDLDLHTLDGNARQALVPVSAVRQIDATGVGPLPEGTKVTSLPRVALHFLDGQVLRAHVLTPASLQRFGALWDLVDAQSGDHRISAIPYTSLKAAFYVRHWDTRPPLERSDSVAGAQLAQRNKLAEIHARRSRVAFASRLTRRPRNLLGRMERRPPADGEDPSPKKGDQ